MSLVDLLARLDNLTISFMVAVAALLQAMMISFQLVLKQRYQGIWFALLGNLCCAAGFLLIYLRDSLSLLFTVVIANVLILVGVSQAYLAACRFMGRKFHAAWVGLALLGCSFFLIHATYVRYDIGIRVAAISLACAIPLGLTAYVLLTCGEACSYRSAARLTAIPYLLSAILLVLRGIGVLIFPIRSLLNQDHMQAFAFLMMFVLGYLWTVGFTVMISQRLYSDVNELATIDHLTRLLNRRAMASLLEVEAARSKRYGAPYAVLLVDLDHFKHINDTYGHKAGDSLMIEMAHILRNTIRAQDMVARWGGDEFLVLLPETTAEQATHTAERLRAAVEAAHFAACEVPHRITISVGAIGTDGMDLTLEKALQIADERLYKAKISRNAVVAAD